MVIYYHRGTGNLTVHFDVFELTSAFHRIQWKIQRIRLMKRAVV